MTMKPVFKHPHEELYEITRDLLQATNDESLIHSTLGPLAERYNAVCRRLEEEVEHQEHAHQLLAKMISSKLHAKTDDQIIGMLQVIKSHIPVQANPVEETTGESYRQWLDRRFPSPKASMLRERLEAVAKNMDANDYNPELGPTWVDAIYSIIADLAAVESGANLAKLRQAHQHLVDTSLRLDRGERFDIRSMVRRAEEMLRQLLDEAEAAARAKPAPLNLGGSEPSSNNAVSTALSEMSTAMSSTPVSSPPSQQTFDQIAEAVGEAQDDLMAAKQLLGEAVKAMVPANQSLSVRVAIDNIGNAWGKLQGALQKGAVEDMSGSSTPPGKPREHEPFVRRGNDIIAKGPDLTPAAMMDDLARVLGWRTDFATGDSPITWAKCLDAVLKLRRDKPADTKGPELGIEVVKFRGTNDKQDCIVQLVVNGVAVAILTQTGPPAQRQPTAEFAESLRLELGLIPVWDVTLCDENGCYAQHVAAATSHEAIQKLIEQRLSKKITKVTAIRVDL